MKYYRKKSGLTQEQVAEKLGIKPSNYAAYERGSRNPKFDRLAEIAQILGVSYNHLQTGAEQILIDLLHSHLKGAILGDVAGFYAYHSDVSHSQDILSVISSYFSKWRQFFEAEVPNFYKRYLEDIDLVAVMELNSLYKNAERAYDIEQPQKPFGEFHFNITNGDQTLDYPTVYKLAFCIAASLYLNENDAEVILNEVQELQGIDDDDESALMNFTINVFGPYIAHITKALEVIADNNATADNFEPALLFNVFWYLPNDDELSEGAIGEEEYLPGQTAEG